MCYKFHQKFVSQHLLSYFYHAMSASDGHQVSGIVYEGPTKSLSFGINMLGCVNFVQGVSTCKQLRLPSVSE